MEHDDKEVNLEFNLPGFEKKDIKVNLTDDKVEITAEKTHEKKIKNKGFFHEEKSYRSFYYHTNIPAINANKSKVEFKNQKLKITAPKKKKVKVSA
jgi:HSP20 family protein